MKELKLSELTEFCDLYLVRPTGEEVRVGMTIKIGGIPMLRLYDKPAYMSGSLYLINCTHRLDAYPSAPALVPFVNEPEPEPFDPQLADIEAERHFRPKR